MKGESVCVCVCVCVYVCVCECVCVCVCVLAHERQETTKHRFKKGIKRYRYIHFLRIKFKIDLTTTTKAICATSVAEPYSHAFFKPLCHLNVNNL